MLISSAVKRIISRSRIKGVVAVAKAYVLDLESFSVDWRVCVSGRKKFFFAGRIITNFLFSYFLIALSQSGS